MSIIRLFKSVLKKKFFSPYKYAKSIGVNIGTDCFVPDKDTWSSEPYLISVGNHCQITSGVRIFTHGGGMLLGDIFRILTYLAELLSVIGCISVTILS